MNRIWITWENQIRNRSMATILGVKLFAIVCHGNRYKRYFFCLFRTLITLFKEKPKIVFAQNPSIVLNYFLICCRVFFKYKLVCDAHYAGVISYSGCSIFQKFLDLCNYMADLVIVTNKEHASYITNLGGKAVICEDPLPDIDRYYTDEREEEKLVFFICSYDVDEPYHKAFKAAEILAQDNFVFMVTGNYMKAGIDKDNYPSVNFLGYLPDSEYYTKLFQCNVVVDLTESDNCLVCGAYEAMAAEKPLVTSDTACLRNYFVKGTVFTKHNETSIASAIKSAYLNRKTLKSDIKEWKNSIHVQQTARIDDIFKALGTTT